MAGHSGRDRTAGVLLYAVAAFLIAFGLLDLWTPRILPYHEAYLGNPQESLDPKVVDLLLSALRIIGILLLALGTGLAVLVAIPLRRGEAWAWWTIAVLWFGSLAALLGIVSRIGRNAPWWIIALNLCLLAIGLLLSRPATRRRP